MAATNEDLFVPRTRLQFGDQAFKVAASGSCNNLPLDIRSTRNIQTFNSAALGFILLTHLSAATARQARGIISAELFYRPSPSPACRQHQIMKDAVHSTWQYFKISRIFSYKSKL